MKVIAEIGLVHSGCLGTAMAYCTAVANAGADVVKFQNHTGDAVASFRPGTHFPQDADRQSFWKRTALTTDEWSQLIDHAHNVGLGFCVSVFSHEAIDQLEGLPVDLWKLGSAQVSDLSLVERLAGMWAPLIISSGMSDWQELANAVNLAVRIEATSGPGQLRPSPYILQCSSEYPCPPEHVGVNVMQQMKEKYKDLPVGISDHSGTIWPSLIAAANGADLCEVHVCWSRECFGADVPASITIDELRQLVQGVRFVEKMTAVDKDKQAKSMEGMRRLFRQ